MRCLSLMEPAVSTVTQGSLMSWKTWNPEIWLTNFPGMENIWKMMKKVKRPGKAEQWAIILKKISRGFEFQHYIQKIWTLLLPAAPFINQVKGLIKVITGPKGFSFWQSPQFISMICIIKALNTDLMTLSHLHDKTTFRCKTATFVIPLPRWLQNIN